jgi:DNA-binding NtrC family response regulator
VDWTNDMSDPCVLLVDDDALLLDSLVRCVRGRFAVRTAMSARRGLDMIRERPGEFFVIVTDIHMPQMDGPAFLELAVRVAPDAKMILISGAFETKTLLRAVNGAGVFRALTKPVAPARLLSALDDAWRAYAAATGASRTTARASAKSA